MAQAENPKKAFSVSQNYIKNIIQIGRCKKQSTINCVAMMIYSGCVWKTITIFFEFVVFRNEGFLASQSFLNFMLLFFCVFSGDNVWTL